MIVVQIEDAGANCLSCNWPQERLYVTAPGDADGWRFYQQNGGLCAECFLAGAFEAKEALEVYEAGSLVEVEDELA